MFIYLLVLVTLLYYFTASSLLYLSLHANAWDLGVFNQVLFNSLNGHPFTYSFRPFANYLGDHFSPTLILLSPLAIFKTSLPLLFIQALALSLAVFVLYLLARRVLGGKFLPLSLAAAFAFNPFTLQIINFDFHPDSFFPVFFFTAAYFLFTRRDFLSLVFLILLSLIREDAFLLILPLAVWAFVYLKQKKLALGALFFSLAYTAIIIFFLMPRFRGNESSPLAEHYPYLGSSFGQIVFTLLSQPQVVLEKLLGQAELTTLVKFFASTGLLAFLGPVVLIASAPIFLSHLLSVVPMRINFAGHYSAEPLSVMFLSLIFGLRFLIRHSGRGSGLTAGEAGIQALDHSSRAGMTVGSQKLLALYLTANTITGFILFSPLPPSFSADVNRFTINSHTRLFFGLKKLIPPGASVSAQSNLVPELAFRREVYEFPVLKNAEYVFLDAKGHISGQSQLKGFFEKKSRLESLGYQLIKDEDGFQIYKKVGP